MKKLLINGIVFVVIFAISAGGSWYYSQMNKTEPEVDETVEAETPVASDESKDGFNPEEAQLLIPKDPGAEAILKLAKQLAAREKALIEREEDLKRREYQANMMLEDAQREQNDLSALQAKLENQIGQAQSLLQQIEKQKQELDAIKLTIEKSGADAKEALTAEEKKESEQAARIAQIYGNMPEENAAKLLKQMCDGGRLDFARKVIGALDQKKATKILVELGDESLINQLLEQLEFKPVAEEAAGRFRKWR